MRKSPKTKGRTSVNVALSLFLLIMFIIFTAACSGGGASGESSGEESGGGETTGESTSAGTGGYPVEITDSLGREVTIDSEPERVASMAPSVTETLFALGAGDKVVGVTTSDDYPEEVAEIESIGDFQQVNVEKLLDLDVDLLFHSYDSTTAEDAAELEEQTNADVVVVNPKTLDEVLSSMELVGRAAGEPEAGRELEQDLRSEIEEIVASVEGEPEPTVFYELFDDPLQTVGPGSFVHDALVVAGAENIAADTDKGYPSYSAETVIEKDPDFYLIGSSTGVTAEDVAERPGFSSLRAVEEDHVITIDDGLVSRPGPRIVEGIREISTAVHLESTERSDE